MLSCSVMSDSATPRSLACQAPLSMELPRQVYWSGLPCPPPGDVPNPGIEPGLPHCRQTLYCLSHQGSPEDLPGTTKTSDTSGTPYSPTRGCFASFPALSGQGHSLLCLSLLILEDPTPVQLLPGPGNVVLPSLSGLFGTVRLS